MPLYREENINSDTKLGLWEITESVEELMEMLPLEAYHHERLKDIHHDMVKSEWLAIRAAIITMEGYLPKVLYTELGKPYLEDGRHISFSHTHNKLAGVIISSKSEVGIDVEHKRESVIRIAPKFMREKESASVTDKNKMYHLLAYWGAKEALYKIHGEKCLNFKENLIVEPFDFLDKGNSKGHISLDGKIRTYDVHYEKIEDFMLVYAMNT